MEIDMDRRLKKVILTIGHNLKVKLPLGKTNEKGEDHYWHYVAQFFASRELAQKYAKDKFPGRKCHIVRVRADATQVQPKPREYKEEVHATPVATS
jgi:hypothetical protein